MPTRNPALRTHLATRASVPSKTFAPGPVPDRAEIEDMLRLALRVPDHGQLEPWRLIVLGPADMARLADLGEEIARASGGDDQRIAKGRGQFDRGSVAVVVISSPRDTPKVPIAEQRLSAGALGMNLLHAAAALGYDANWLTGWVAHDPAFTARAFGCGGQETVAGIIHIGTRGDTPLTERARPDLTARVSWGLA